MRGFRDLLRAHPELASEYASQKERLAEKFSNDRGSYQRDKGGVIERILLSAGHKLT